MVGMALGFFTMGAWANAVQTLLHSPSQIGIEQATLDSPRLYDFKDCDTWYHSARLHPCTFGSKHATHTVVMFGDSVLAQWFPAVSELYTKQNDWRLIVLTKSACSASEVNYFYPAIKSYYSVCDLWRRRAVRYMQRLHPDVVIMGSTHYDYTPRQWVTGTRAVLKRLSPATHSIVVLSPTPELGFDGLACLSAQANWPHWFPLAKNCSRPLPPVSKSGTYALLQRAARPYPNAHVVNLRLAVCPGGRCRARIGDHIVYRDGQHLTASFVKTLAPALRAALRRNDVPY